MLDLYKQLLERMASISPGVRTHLGGEHFQLHIDEDEVTPKLLVLECFSLMIDEVYEIGIEFYCSRDDLCDSLYHLDKTLLLFEVIYPTPLYRSISEDNDFKKWIVSVVRDNAGDPDNTTVVNLLQYLVDDHSDTQTLFQDTYTFLIDKIQSTPIFDIYISSILDSDNISVPVPIDSESTINYLNYIQEKFTKLLKVVDCISRELSNNSINIELIYNRISIYKNNSIKENTLNNNIWIWQTQQRTNIPQTTTEQTLLVRLIREFESITPLYEDYFKLHNKTLTRNDIISIIIGCFEKSINKESFIDLIDSTFKRLSYLLSPTDIELQTFIQKSCLLIIKEFY